jgi:hypothetical protein
MFAKFFHMEHWWRFLFALKHRWRQEGNELWLCGKHHPVMAKNDSLFDANKDTAWSMDTTSLSTIKKCMQEK